MIPVLSLSALKGTTAEATAGSTTACGVVLETPSAPVSTAEKTSLAPEAGQKVAPNAGYAPSMAAVSHAGPERCAICTQNGWTSMARRTRSVRPVEKRCPCTTDQLSTAVKIADPGVALKSAISLTIQAKGTADGMRSWSGIMDGQ